MENQNGLRVLSVRQPWASLIADGRKTIELRSWSTGYRGPVLIVSGVGRWKGVTDHPINGPRGAMICLVDLVDVRTTRESDADQACLVPPDGFGFAWLIENPRRVVNTAIKGKLGLYRADARVMGMIHRV